MKDKWILLAVLLLLVLVMASGCMYPMTVMQRTNRINECALSGKNYEEWFDGPNDSQVYVRCVAPPQGTNPYVWLSKKHPS